MPDIKPADPANYVLCKECSTAKDEEVFYPRDIVTREERAPGLFRKTRDEKATVVYKCPKGHVLEGYTDGAA